MNYIICILGIVIVGASLLALIKTHGIKPIATFTLTELSNIKLFTVKELNEYFIAILGAGQISNLEKTNLDLKFGDNSVKVFGQMFSPRIFFKGTVGIKRWNFNTTKTGTYSLQIENLENISAKKSMLKIRGLLQKRLNLQNLNVIIYPKTNNRRRLIALGLLVIGVLLIAFSLQH